MAELCDHYQDHWDSPSDIYDENRPRWKTSLRDRAEDESKPAWSVATKPNSPAERTYSEGGSLATSRQRPREKCSKNRSPQHRSRSSGVTGTTFASRARQKEPVGPPLQRSRPVSVASRPPTVDRRFRRQSASPARAKRPEPEGRSRRPEHKAFPPKPAPPREKLEIPVQLYPEKEETPSPRLIPINVTEEKMMSSFETAWNDRYLLEPIGPTLGRKNIITKDMEDKLSHKESVYKQQSVETMRNTFLGKTSESSQSYYNGMNGSEERVLDTRGSSYDGSFQDSFFQNGRTSTGSQRSSMDNGKSFTQSSSSYSSYKKTNINGKESESSSHYEQHSDSRDRNGRDEEESVMQSSRRSSSVNTTAANMLERQRRESSKKSSLAGPMPLWLSPADEEMDQSLIRKASSVSSSSKKSVSKTYIA